MSPGYGPLPFPPVSPPPHPESHLRSLLKGLTWRVVATTTIVVIAYQTTGSTELAFTIGGIEFFVKLLLYYLHERAWQWVPPLGRYARKRQAVERRAAARARGPHSWPLA